VNIHVFLCHLYCLYTELEKCLHKDPLTSILQKYKEALTAQQSDFLEGLFCKIPNSDVMVRRPSKMSLSVTRVLKEFLIDQLTEDRWDDSASLKDYLIYTGQFSEDDELWFQENFLDIFELKHSFSVFQWLLQLDPQNIPETALPSEE
jgi:hypothetical protein